MDRESPYYKQLSLLIRMLPIVATESVFALKGGTAINLFVRNFPRLSVDIDLAYLPLEPRIEALENVKAALKRIVDLINAQPDTRAVLQDQKVDELRIVVTSLNATIKIEVSPVARGTLHKPNNLPVQELVEEEYGYAEISVVSLPDLYGGKLCAAMDRQHPRDLFDVRTLLLEEGISRDIFIGFITYALSHPRPINEVMAPNWQPLDETFKAEFDGMTFEPVNLEDLLSVRSKMVNELKKHFTKEDRAFLLSFKQGNPDWTLFDYPDAANLPAIRWKLQNLDKLAKNQAKHKEQLAKLEAVLDEWLE
ncbi:nucleotidyl transferase AbiEii/AbiGii toxin family protein [Marinomonas mediterranea]|uniref:nucleotidyl transferase AbiEii/AbiGii toxin family protein n=1 Tax=Marinomonas mediterranea TaxID=119864 RepID=UPI00234A4C73|nr:nucleotidyl transferase AbiEii/AbiGii toxin family protein [Marinomonas mediterranea]WCN11156.1 nucleotidyl transferase AbiEii/AbiGii toxin family protein [Marinomonas mediterranea]WCN15220.1 nucleotidyl transferase AbiEii/AbiGii toxin family protein [Marinomonas mediterranea]